MSTLTCGATPRAGSHHAARPGQRGLLQREQLGRAGGAAPRRSSGDSICPSTASEMRPVSSETTSTIASVSSAMPSAARCRVPSARPSCVLRDSGRKQPAAAMRSPLHEDGAVVQRRVRQEQAHRADRPRRARRAARRAPRSCAARSSARARSGRRCACRPARRRLDTSSISWPRSLAPPRAMPCRRRLLPEPGERPAQLGLEERRSGRAPRTTRSCRAASSC